MTFGTYSVFLNSSGMSLCCVVVSLSNSISSSGVCSGVLASDFLYAYVSSISDSWLMMRSKYMMTSSSRGEVILILWLSRVCEIEV